MSETIRLGVIVPSVNTVVEEWYPRVVPDGVSVHFARMLIGAGTSPERIIAMDREDGRRAISQIASCRPHAIAYGCTASSIIQGHAFDARLRQEIRENTGAATTTATDSIFAACHALGLKRVTAISPYPEEVDAAEPDGDAILDLAMRAWDPQSDGLVAACLNFRSHLVIDALEARIGKPIVTSTQAVLWRLLRLAGIAAPVTGYGRLLREC